MATSDSRDGSQLLTLTTAWTNTTRGRAVLGIRRLAQLRFVEELMQLRSDGERRVWRSRHNGKTEEALRSLVWGRFREKDDENEAENGSRLQASVPFVLEFLRKMDMDLMIEVEVRRRIRRSRYESPKDHDTGYIPPSARLFLVKPDGNVCTV